MKYVKYTMITLLLIASIVNVYCYYIGHIWVNLAASVLGGILALWIALNDGNINCIIGGL